MDETRLIERFRSVEALYCGATTDGERNAAARARARLLERIEQSDLPGVLPLFLRLRPSDLRSYSLVLAMMRRYGLMPARLVRRRCVAALADSRKVVVEVLVPEFEASSRALRGAIERWLVGAVRAALFGGEAHGEIELLPASTQGELHGDLD